MLHLFSYIAIAFAMFVWLKSNAFVDFFGWIFKRYNGLFIKTYLNDPLSKNVEYPLWLNINFPNNVTKLISCPLCLSFWTNLIIADGLVSWFVGSYLTLMAYLLIDKAYKHKR